jgi:exosome complex component RRP46
MALLPVLLLEKHPRTLVQLVIQILSPLEEPGAVATSINAAACALLAAGSVPMAGVLAAVTIGRRGRDSTLMLNPTSYEELSGLGYLAFLFSGQGESAARPIWSSYVVSPGAIEWSSDELDSAVMLAKKGADSVRDLMKASLGQLERQGTASTRA